MKIYPSFSEFKELSKKFTLVPVRAEIFSDLETPVSAFLKIKKGQYNFLLESVEQEERTGRYSFLGTNPEIVFQSRQAKVEIFNTSTGEKKVSVEKVPLEKLENVLKEYKTFSISQLPNFSGGFIGYLSYDFVRRLEKLPDSTVDELKAYDAFFMLAKNIIAFDHFKRKIIFISNAFIPKFSSIKKAYEESIQHIEKMKSDLDNPLFLIEPARKKTRERFKSNFSRGEFTRNVSKAKKYITEGDVIQVVLSQRWKKKLDIEPFSIYRSLRSVNPSPYMFYLETGDVNLIGSSPEILVKLEGNVATVRPIAGTRKRGKTEKDEERLKKELLNDEKEKAEHIMLVDLGRNELGRVCKAGTIKVTELMGIEKYSHVMHIVSNVIGKLSAGKTSFDLLNATFPAGTVTGAPKIRAMEIIEELESAKRGPYAGAVGYFDFHKNMDFCITIRTIFTKGSKIYLQAGAGIVADSNPEKEYEETLNKVRGLMEAYKLAKDI